MAMKTTFPVILFTAVSVINSSLPVTTWAQQSSESSESIDAGFLFVDGHFIVPPYVFRTQEGQVFVNDVVLDTASLKLGNDDYRRHERRNGRPTRNPWRRLGRDLESGAAVVVFTNQRPITLDAHGAGYELLKVMSDDTARRNAASERPDWLPVESENEEWKRWFAEFQPSPEFLQRAKAEIDRVNSIVVANTASNAAVRRLEASAYPLTILGMALVVLSFGHLLSHRPTSEGVAEKTRFSPEANRMVCRSLILVCALSCLDLFWTLLVSQTGSMRELNPLGSRLIESPGQLIVFKLVATSTAVGLLFALRRVPLAQRASWWSCLVCTLLAVRWLTYNSMFVS